MISEYKSFVGVDVRLNAAVSNPLALRRAVNVDLTIGGALRRRGALRKICEVSPYSVGLFSFAGSLRAVVPCGQSLQDTRPAEVIYEPIGDGTAYGLGTLSKLHAVEVIGSTAVPAAFPYVVVERASGVIEHHWLTTAGVTGTTAVSTRVTLPFDPGKALLKIATKLFCDDPSGGVLRFCSTVNGPSDWTLPRDAGLLAVRQHISGSREIKALGYYRGGLAAVFFADAVQLWQFYADPAKNELITTLNGPGTSAPGSVENMLGDLVYLSRGGIRSLSTSTVTGEVREGDIGASIQDFTDDYDLDTVRPVALWSQARSQYMCAFGSDVWLLTNSPLSKKMGWTKWELPVAVEHMVEHDGEVYVRANDVIYQIDQSYEQDFGTLDVNYDVLTAFLGEKNPGKVKRWHWIDIVQTGTSYVNFHVDTRHELAPAFRHPIKTAHVTYDKGHIGVGVMGESMGVRFTGTEMGWRLDSFAVEVELLKGAGRIPGTYIPLNTVPVVSAGVDTTATAMTPLTLAGTAVDDDGKPLELLTVWSLVSGPGRANFADPNSLTSTVTFSYAGEYILRLTANDGETIVSDDILVVVS